MGSHSSHPSNFEHAAMSDSKEIKINRQLWLQWLGEVGWDGVGPAGETIQHS